MASTAFKKGHCVTFSDVSSTNRCRTGTLRVALAWGTDRHMGTSQKRAHSRRLSWKWNVLGVYEWRRDLFVKHDRWASLQAICRGPPEGNGIPTYRQGQQRPSQDRSLGVKRIKSLWGKGWTRRGLALWAEDVAHGKRALGCFHLGSLASVLSRPLWTPISSSINWVSVVLAVAIMRNHIQQLELLSARGGGSCQYWGVPSVPQGVLLLLESR